MDSTAQQRRFLNCCMHGLLALAAALLCGTGMAQQAPPCGHLSNGQNGPFDYRVERGRRLETVEAFHFTAKVEGLIGGQSGELGQDLDYTLRAFPNHHRALLSVARYSKRSKIDPAPRTAFTVECYFDRALRFVRDDTTARMLYANYLQEVGRKNDAIRQLDQVIELAPDNPFTQYNAGLIFAEMGAFDRALRQAHVALAGGFTRTDLRDKLKAAGKWMEPPEAPTAPTAVPAASAASAAGG
jgi:tetratricopeptide (TPR) repeat protein